MNWFQQFSPFWRRRHSFAPFPLPRAPSITDLREWNVEVDPVSYVPPVPVGSSLKVSLHRILIEAGIAMTPATSSWDPRAWYALYRYGSDFAGTAPALRLYAGAIDRDPRMSAVASEEVGAGITCYLLREHLEVDHIADAYACIQNGELTYVGSASEKRPDYFCEDRNRETVLAESKGATGTRCNIAGRIDPEGWAQVGNVAPTNLSLRASCGRVVIGTHFCVQGIHPRSETTTIIKDPDGPRGNQTRPDSDMVIRLSYAKVLRFMGQDALAERVMLRQEIPHDLPLDDLPELQGVQFLPLGATPFGDVIGLYAPVARTLFQQSQQSLSRVIPESLQSFGNLRGLLEGIGYALPNGVLVCHHPEVLT